MRFANAALFAVGLGALPLSPAKAQYCSSSPLTWPLCFAEGAVNTVAIAAAAPFNAGSGRLYYYRNGHYYRTHRDYHGVRYYHSAHSHGHRHHMTAANTARITKSPAATDRVAAAPTATAPTTSDATAIEPPPRTPQLALKKQ